MDILCAPRPDEALHSSVLAGDLSQVQCELQRLEKANYPVTLSRAMKTCVGTRNTGAFKLLLQHGEVDESVAEEAARSESTDLVRAILDHGWPIDRRLRRGSLPSILSLAIRNSDFLEWLLAQGASLDATSTLNETVLSFAVREGTMKVIKKLIAIGADVSRGDLLHSAAQREPSSDTEELIDILVRAGTPVDTYEFDNEVARVLRYGFKLGTALHTACDEQNLLAADALLKHGADPYRLMKQCENLVPPTPFQLATRTPRMRDVLERHIAARQSV
ncbi:hypothetical protein CERZMDRAFT_87109 [Cercospora zeae-maydis SCOH1-5]|uniref:Uncharacterized protein n=1 Tax=Cercospora zeae-maydis SCOH1-5 TaxID=717836 RepID=A0A6A6F758_9PEZI|nr:hypothetical protein CERZMDRAFT_87109 [Cercospora zeae-maydis SCOH1-5]